MHLLAQTNFTALGFRLALFMLCSLFVGMAVREYARAWMATRLGDPTPRLWGRLGLGPSRWFEPFGSGLVPGLLAVLWAVGVFVIPAAYAKPAPIDPSYLRNGRRDLVLSSLAGPLATLALGAVGGLALRGVGGAGESARFLAVFAFTNMALTVFHLLPIPGLDGARLVALTLPPQAAQVYRNADRYLPLFVLVVLFIFGTLVLGFLTALADALCSAAAGIDCRALL
jgi:Zn-dependent protease